MRPILLVEDAVPPPDSLRGMLRNAGYMVDRVTGDREAFDYLRRADKPGLVILRARKPNPQLLDRLKQAGVLVLVVDGGHPKAEAEWSPVNADELLDTLKRTYLREGGDARLVWVIEDRAAVRAVVAFTLWAEGYRVATVVDPCGAADRLRAGDRPDLILVGHCPAGPVPPAALGNVPVVPLPDVAGQPGRRRGTARARAAPLRAGGVSRAEV